MLSDMLCLRMWRVLWIGDITQTVLRCVSHSPLGRWLCIPPRSVFRLVIKAHCYLHENPVHAAFCFGALNDYLSHSPIQPRQNAEIEGQEDRSHKAHEEAEEYREETDRALTPSLASLIGKAFDCLKRYFEITGDLTDYASDLLMHKLGFTTSRKKNVTFKELHTRYLKLRDKYCQTMKELIAAKREHISIIDRHNETIATLNTVEEGRVREKQEYSETLVKLIAVEDERVRERQAYSETLVKLIVIEDERRVETHEYSEILVKLTTTQKSCIAALEERNALIKANQELRTDFEEVSRRLKELELERSEEPAGAWGKHLNWMPSRTPKAKNDPAGTKERARE